MARFPLQFQATDQLGKIIVGETVTLTLTGTTTVATCYEASSGGSAIPNGELTTDSNGRVKYWVDEADYASTQYFRITLTGAEFVTQIVDDVVILPITSTGFATTALDNLASVAINTSLVSDTDSTDNLGSTTKSWLTTYTDNIDTTSGTSLTIKTATVTCVVFDTSQNADFQTNNITTGGKLRLDVDGTAINAAGSINFGASTTDSAIYFNGTSLKIDSSTNTVIAVNGTTKVTIASGSITMAVQVNYADNQLIRPMLKDYSELTKAVASSGSTQTLDIEDGNVFHIILDANCTFTFSNPVASNDMTSFTLVLHMDSNGGWASTWPASVDWEDGTAPTLITTASSISILSFFTIDGGTTWHGVLGSSDSK